MHFVLDLRQLTQVVWLDSLDLDLEDAEEAEEADILWSGYCRRLLCGWQWLLDAWMPWGSGRIANLQK